MTSLFSVYFLWEASIQTLFDIINHFFAEFSLFLSITFPFSIFIFSHLLVLIHLQFCFYLTPCWIGNTLLSAIVHRFLQSVGKTSLITMETKTNQWGMKEMSAKYQLCPSWMTWSSQATLTLSYAKHVDKRLH